MDDFGLVEAVDRFGEGVVVRVADASDGRIDACLGQSLRILDRHVLNALVRVVNQAAAMKGTPLIEGLLESIEDEPGMRRPAPPVNRQSGARRRR